MTTGRSASSGPRSAAATRTSVLARNRDFLLLWSGESVSMLGSEISVVALPSLAVLVFGSGAAGVGLLVALQWLPFVILAPIMGVVTDRLRRRPLMQIANLARVVVLGSLPLAAVAGHLSMAHLYGAALLKGIFDVVFQIAYQAYMPQLLDEADVVHGNVVTQQSRSVALMVGRLAGGGLVGLIGPARAVAADAASYLVAAASLLFVRTDESPPAPSRPGFAAILRDIRRGAHLAMGNRLVRSLMLTTMLGNMAGKLTFAMIFVYAYHDVHFNAGQLGLVLSLGSAPVLLGAALSGRIITRLGTGRALVLTHVLLAIAFALTPLAAVGGRFLAFVVIVVSQGIAAFTTPITNVSVMTLIQRATPVRAIGRILGAVLPFVWGANALGPTLGSVVAAVTNTSLTFLLAAMLAAAAVAGLITGAVHRVRDEVPGRLRVALPSQDA